MSTGKFFSDVSEENVAFVFIESSVTRTEVAPENMDFYVRA